MSYAMYSANDWCFFCLMRRADKDFHLTSRLCRTPLYRVRKALRASRNSLPNKFFVKSFLDEDQDSSTWQLVTILLHGSVTTVVVDIYKNSIYKNDGRAFWKLKFIKMTNEIMPFPQFRYLKSNFISQIQKKKKLWRRCLIGVLVWETLIFSNISPLHELSV